MNIVTYGDASLIASLRPDDPLPPPIEGAPPAGCDLAVSCRYAKKVPKEWLDIPRLGWINLHFGKLPEYRGVRPIGNAILNGELYITVTWHRMTEEWDAGDIVAEWHHPIHDKGAAALYSDCRRIAADLWGFMEGDGLEETILAARPQYGRPAYYSAAYWQRQECIFRRYQRAFEWSPH